MPNLSIKFDDEDLKAIRKKAADLRIPPTVYCRSLIIQGLRNAEEHGRLKNEK